MLTLHHVGRRFPGSGPPALEDISFRVEHGDFIALVGPSGCGKSTLLRLLAGLDRPDAGRLCWDEAGPARRPVAVVFQDPTLLPWASAAENVRLPLRLRGMPHARSQPLVEQALHRVGLSAFALHRPRALSGGMRMRVSIARALVQRPRLLLMDEPFAALDEPTRHELQDALRALASKTATVFVTHSSAEAAFLARRTLVLTARPGRVAAEIASPLPDGPGRRRSPEFHALADRIAAAAAGAAGRP